MFDRMPDNKYLLSKDDQPNWVNENIIAPAKNVGATAVNAAANVINYARPDTVGKLDLVPQHSASTGSSDWLVQTASMTAASLITYTGYGRVAGAGLRALGAVAGLEGRMAALAADKTVAQIAGAALLDGTRDVQDGETRLGNILGSTSTFAGFSILNRAFRPVTEQLAAAAQKATGLSSALVNGGRGLIHMGVGSTAALAGVTIADSTNKSILDGTPTLVLDANRLPSAMLAGGLMNIGVNAKVGNRTIQEWISRPVDKAAQAITGKMPLADFVAEHQLAADNSGNIRSRALAVHLLDLPLTSVRLGSSTGGKNTIGIGEKSMNKLNTATGAELERTRSEVASLLGNRLAGQLATRNGYLPGVLDSTGIRDALNDGRVYIEVNGNKLNTDNLREHIGANMLDIHLDGEFIVPPEGQHIVLDDASSAKKVLAEWGKLAQHSDSITVEPSGTLLAFTQEHLGLVAGPEPGWDGRLPVKAAINSKSSIARMFVETHQTAPQVNLNTDNRIVLEIKNNSGNTIEFHKGMQIGSLVFYTLTGNGEQAAGSFFNGQKQITGAKVAAAGDVEPAPQTTATEVKLTEAQARAADKSPTAQATSRTVAESTARVQASRPEQIALIEGLSRSALEIMPPEVMARIHDTVPDQTAISPRGDHSAASLVPEIASEESRLNMVAGNYLESHQRIASSNPQSGIPEGSGFHTVTETNWNAIHN